MPPTTTTPPAQSAAIAEDLRAVVARLVRRLRAGYAVPPHQFSVLRTLESGGPQTASALAAVELVRPQSMAHTLQQLDEAGFLTRRPDPSDRRQTLVDLSERGRTALADQRRGITGWLATALDEHLDADERARVADAVALLSRVVDG